MDPWHSKRHLGIDILKSAASHAPHPKTEKKPDASRFCVWVKHPSKLRYQWGNTNGIFQELQPLCIFCVVTNSMISPSCLVGLLTVGWLQQVELCKWSDCLQHCGSFLCWNSTQTSCCLTCRSETMTWNNRCSDEQKLPRSTFLKIYAVLSWCHAFLTPWTSNNRVIQTSCFCARIQTLKALWNLRL